MTSCARSLHVGGEPFSEQALNVGQSEERNHARGERERQHETQQRPSEAPRLPVNVDESLLCRKIPKFADQCAISGAGRDVNLM